MAVTIQFTKEVLPQGFKLTKDFVSSPFFDKTVETIKENLPKDKEIFIVTQTDISNRDSSSYKPAFLSKNLENRIKLDSVIKNIKNNKGHRVPQVDGIWMNNKEKDKVILSFSQTAPIIVAECSNYIFISTMLRKDITTENFRKILNLLPYKKSKATFKLLSSTNFKYPEGSLSSQIEKIVKDLGCNFETTELDSNVNKNPHFFGYNEKIDGFPELGLANNLAAIM